MIILAISSHRIIDIMFFGSEVVNISKLKELQVGNFTIDIMRQTFKTTEEQCLAHHAQITRQWVHHSHAVFCGISGIICIIGTLRQRVVQYFIKSASYELLTHQIQLLVFLILFAFDNERTLERSRNFHIIISIDTQNILYYITRTDRKSTRLNSSHQITS